MSSGGPTNPDGAVYVCVVGYHKGIVVDWHGNLLQSVQKLPH